MLSAQVIPQDMDVLTVKEPQEKEKTQALCAWILRINDIYGNGILFAIAKENLSRLKPPKTTKFLLWHAKTWSEKTCNDAK